MPQNITDTDTARRVRRFHNESMWRMGWVGTGVAAPQRGGWSLFDETGAGSVQTLPRPKKKQQQKNTSCMRKASTGQVEKGYIKNQVTYPKKGLLYLGSETCDQTQDKGDTERPRLKGPASCFTGHVGDAQTIAVTPACRLCPLRRPARGEENPLRRDGV